MKNIKFSFISICAASAMNFFHLSSEASLLYSAELFEQGSSRKTKLFDMKHSQEGSEAGVDVLSTIYLDPAGKPALSEKIRVRGEKLVRVDITQHQTGEESFVEVRDAKIHFSLTKDGKTKTAEEAYREPLVMSGNFVRFVHANWKQLMEKGSLEFRYAVWYRLDTVGFKLIRESEEGDGPARKVRLKMKPTSFVIAALVDPVLFTFSHDGSKLLELNGRVAPKIKKGDSFKDLDAEAVYQHP